MKIKKLNCTLLVRERRVLLKALRFYYEHAPSENDGYQDKQDYRLAVCLAAWLQASLE